ncbi:MAG: hypothetical protein JSV03_09305 [Planctomycetota bacterium]|nr:MAG: hypothetical protein JSV03_09305 [Planctomycetota bacterium]
MMLLTTCRFFSLFIVLGWLGSATLGQTPIFEDLLTDASKISGQAGSGIFSANGYTLTHTGGTSTNGEPRSLDFVWYDLPGLGSDGTGSFEFDVTGLFPNAGCTGNEVAEACDSTGLNPATVKNDFWASPYAVMMRKINDPEWATYTNKLKLSGRAGPDAETDWKAGFSPVLSWDGTVTYRFRVTWTGATLRIWRGLPGQTLSVLAPSSNWTLNNSFTPNILHIQLGSSFWTSTTVNREFGGAPGTTYSLLRVYEEDLGGAATPPGSPPPPPPTEVSIDLGSPDVADGMTHPQVADGTTTATTIGSKSCRMNVDPATDHYFYFTVTDEFAYNGNRPNTDITIDYYDTGSGNLDLQYDSSDPNWLPNPAYKQSSDSITLTGTNTWKQHTFHVTDAYFGNRQNGGSDFRIARPGTNTFYLDLIHATGPPCKATNPIPPHQANYVSVDADLGWSTAAGANSYDVHFGTTSPGTFQGNQTGITFEPGTLNFNTTYYWRVDSVGDTGTTTGDVWSFTTKSETATGVTLGISPDGRFFTIDGVPTFLHGISYYGNQYITTGSFRTQDLDDMLVDGFNWLRVWAYWAWPWYTGPNVSALNKDGTVREPYMTRLKTLIAECDARGIIVDCVMLRDTYNEWHSPDTLARHLTAAQTLATELLPYRNVYFDLGNERDNRGCLVPFDEMPQLINAVKTIDPDRLCTFSQGGMIDSQSVLNDYINVGMVDFFAVHMCRTSECPSLTYGEVQKYIGWMANLGTRVPIHLQEPFRRGNRAAWNPVQEDYYRDETGGKVAEAAGWCFHNGGNDAYSADGRPYRSFNMSDPEGRLYDQLDSVELSATDNAILQIGSTDANIRRYQAEYNEQLSHNIGRKEDLVWSANVAQDSAGYLTTGPFIDTVPVGNHQVTWRLMIDNNTVDNDPIVTLDVYTGGNQLAAHTVNRQDFNAANTWQTFDLNFGSTGQQDLEFRTYWYDEAYIKCDWVQLTIGGGIPQPPIIAEVFPDPNIVHPGTEYIKQLTLVQGNPAPTWSVVQGPSGTQVNVNGSVSGWTPTVSDLGSSYRFIIQASNTEGSDIEEWDVEVHSIADFDDDNDVDQEDFGWFQTCYSGPGAFPTTECEPADFDSDRDVDVEDFVTFQNCMGGPNNPPGC